MPTASVDVGMPYVIWNRETGVPQLTFDYYEALILAQQMGGGYVTKYDDIAANPGHPLHNDPRLARVMAPYLGARQRERAEAQSPLPRLTQEEVPSPDPITLGAPPTVTPVNDQMLFTPKNVQAQQAIDFNIPTTPNLGQPETVVATDLWRGFDDPERHRVNKLYADNLRKDMAARYNPPVSPSTTPPTVGPIEDANALFAQNLELQRQFDAEAAGHRLRNLSHRLGQDNRSTGEQIEAAARVNEAARRREEAQRANSQPVVSPVEEQMERVKEQLGQTPKSKWDWDNPNIRTYSTYMEPPATTPTIPVNVVRDGFGNPIKAGDGYLRSRTDEEILRDEQDPYWWMR